MEHLDDQNTLFAHRTSSKNYRKYYINNTSDGNSLVIWLKSLSIVEVYDLLIKLSMIVKLFNSQMHIGFVYNPFLFTY